MHGIPTLWRLRKERTLGNNHVAFYFWLRHAADESGKLIATIKRLADDMDLSDRTIYRLLDDLESADLIHRPPAAGKRQIILEVSTGHENRAVAPEKAKQKRSAKSQPMTRQRIKGPLGTAAQPMTPETYLVAEVVSEVGTQPHEIAMDSKNNLLLGSGIPIRDSLQGVGGCLPLGEGTPPTLTEEKAQQGQAFFASMQSLGPQPKAKPAWETKRYKWEEPTK